MKLWSSRKLDEPEISPDSLPTPLANFSQDRVAARTLEAGASKESRMHDRDAARARQRSVFDFISWASDDVEAPGGISWKVPPTRHPPLVQAFSFLVYHRVLPLVSND